MIQKEFLLVLYHLFNTSKKFSAFINLLLKKINMKRSIILFTTTLFAFSFSATAQSTKNDVKEKAYKATYSSDFKMAMLN